MAANNFIRGIIVCSNVVQNEERIIGMRENYFNKNRLFSRWLLERMHSPCPFEKKSREQKKTTKLIETKMVRFGVKVICALWAAAATLKMRCSKKNQNHHWTFFCCVKITNSAKHLIHYKNSQTKLIGAFCFRLATNTVNLFDLTWMLWKLYHSKICSVFFLFWLLKTVERTQIQYYHIRCVVFFVSIKSYDKERWGGKEWKRSTKQQGCNA